ncbi:MAG: hypothetical protein BGO98_40105 [Myxococcales bacterium 68-20]|nr:HdeD family acid-resistance protein [Myxococcales bacterium]OJY16195.1 MAG: hypothetical protein BGO98_40105 [Myxococcales bacterium 68-20]
MDTTTFFEARNWWAYVLRGIAAVVFGLLTWIFPSMALLTLVLLFGAYALADGVSAIVAAFQRTVRESPRWLLVVYGLVSIAAAVIAVLYPGITALALVLLIAARAIVTGAIEIAAAVRLRRSVQGEWLLAASGVLSIVFGVLLFLFPGPGALGLLLWIGAWAILLGGLLIALGIRLRRMKQRGLGPTLPVPAEGLAGSH